MQRWGGTINGYLVEAIGLESIIFPSRGKVLHYSIPQLVLGAVVETAFAG